MPTYKVPVNGTVVHVKADNSAQAVRAATKPLIGSITTLTPDEIADIAIGGGSIIDAKAVLKNEPEEVAETAENVEPSDGR